MAVLVGELLGGGEIHDLVVHTGVLDRGALGRAEAVHHEHTGFVAVAVELGVNDLVLGVVARCLALAGLHVLLGCGLLGVVALGGAHALGEHVHARNGDGHAECAGDGKAGDAAAGLTEQVALGVQLVLCGILHDAILSG